ncbi:MAG: type II toxin-antitoxin system Phd/YefM family antitoxin [Clostridiales bacterium]|jgi:PHD/YefM family antitoxin component YafN of YafNO toxin-antitoxin module|nr:type II toxin-antitoxin system Phd/YefM family antitoxin [Clostridiales bacterium]
MTNFDATQAHDKFFDLLKDVTERNEIAKIVGKTGNAIIMSEDEYNSISETLYLMGIPGMWKSIIEGINTPISECVEINEI